MAASIKPLKDTNLCIRTDNQRADTSLGSLKTLYPVSSTFKTRQTSNSGRLIPFEAIDNKIYKANSNCTCFLPLKVEYMHGLRPFLRYITLIWEVHQTAK